MINNYNKWKFETTFQDIFRVKLNLLSEENNMEISLLKKVILNDSINKLKLSWFNLESRILLAGIAIKRMQMTGNSMFIKSMAHNDSAETRDRRIDRRWQYFLFRHTIPLFRARRNAEYVFPFYLTCTDLFLTNCLICIRVRPGTN